MEAQPLGRFEVSNNNILPFYNQSIGQNSSLPVRTNLSSVDSLIGSLHYSRTETDGVAEGTFIESIETNAKGISQMSDQDVIVKYIDILDKDRREMEKRLTEDRKESEKRINDTVSRMECSINELNHDVKQTRGLTITAVIGISAIIIASVIALSQIVTQLVSIVIAK